MDNKYNKNEFNKIILELHNDKTFNPYLILNISKIYTEQELKKQYRLYALKTHPDKGGNPEHFQMVSKSYIYLLKALKHNLPEKPLEIVKEEFDNYILEQTLNNKHNIKLNNDFDINKFNDVFNEYHINNDVSRGYGDFLKENYTQQRPTNDGNIFSNSFNLSLFNKMFKEYNIEKNNRQIVKIDNPEEMKYNNGYELGITEIDDYSKNYNINDNNMSKLDYTDIKVAYTSEKLVDEKQTNIKEWKSLKELKDARSKITYELSDEDKILMEQREENTRQKESDRINILKIQDREAERQFQRINKIMLKNQ